MYLNLLKHIEHIIRKATSVVEGHRFNSCQARHLLIFILALFSHSVLSAQPTAHWQQTSYITASFLDIALNSEYDSRTSKLRKWQKPIYFSIDDDSIDKRLHQKLVEHQLHHLADITSLIISPATDSSTTNLQIIFTSESELLDTLKQTQLNMSRKQLQQVLFGTICLGHITVKSNFEIEHATVIIPIDRARSHGKLLSCVIEELSQTMGLINDSDSVFPSIFNDKSFDTYLSGLDYILLSLLYHPTLKAGMDSNSVEKSVRQLLASKDFQQKIKHAEQLVKHKSVQNLTD